MELSNILSSTLSAKLPLWQLLIFGGTTFIAGRIIGSFRGIHSTPTAEKAKSRAPKLPNISQDTKLVLIIRTDLGMSKGKIAAQCSHATLACYKAAQRQAQDMLRAWEYSGQAKVTLKCMSEEELLDLQKKAKANGLVAQSILDAGRTQIAAGSRTVLGIGPGPVGAIDRISGHLKLY